MMPRNPISGRLQIEITVSHGDANTGIAILLPCKYLPPQDPYLSGLYRSIAIRVACMVYCVAHHAIATGDLELRET